MTQFEVEVTTVVRVTLDEAKFTEEFLAEFREGFFPFFDLGDHAEHIGQLAAREVYDFSSDDFVEGYGPVGDLIIAAEVLSVETEGLLIPHAINLQGSGPAPIEPREG